MSNSFTSLGISESALLLRAKRAEVIANNLANADTPGFKARDIDFKAASAQATQSNGISQQAAISQTVTNSKHINFNSSQNIFNPALHLQYRDPSQLTLDDNTVDGQIEIAAFTETALRYQASLDFLSGRVRSLMTVLKGE